MEELRRLRFVWNYGGNTPPHDQPSSPMSHRSNRPVTSSRTRRARSFVRHLLQRSFRAYEFLLALGDWPLGATCLEQRKSSTRARTTRSRSQTPYAPAQRSRAHCGLDCSDSSSPDLSAGLPASASAQAPGRSRPRWSTSESRTSGWTGSRAQCTLTRRPWWRWRQRSTSARCIRKHSDSPARSWCTRHCVPVLRPISPRR